MLSIIIIKSVHFNVTFSSRNFLPRQGYVQLAHARKQTLVTFPTYSLRPGDSKPNLGVWVDPGPLTQHLCLGAVTSGDALRSARLATCSLRHWRTAERLTCYPRSSTPCQPLPPLLSLLFPFGYRYTCV